MVTEQETLIYVEEKDKAEATAGAKLFAKNSVKNRAYINTLGVELAMKYLASEGINVNNLHNIHSMHKFIEEFDIADIILPNIHIDVRVVFSDKFIFIPKTHFEYGLTPDIYLILQLADDYSHVKFLGFVEPKLINRNNANKDYYFIEKEKLSAVTNLKEYIVKSKNNTTQLLDEYTIDIAEANFISMVDNDLNENGKKSLIGNLIKSDYLRDKFIEYSNFEILSYKAMNDSSFTELLKTTETSSENTPFVIAPVINDILDDNISETTVVSENLSIVTNEFDLFDNNTTDEFNEFEPDEIVNQNMPTIEDTNTFKNILPDLEITQPVVDTINAVTDINNNGEDILETAADLTAKNILEHFPSVEQNDSDTTINELSIDDIIEQSTDSLTGTIEDLSGNDLEILPPDNSEIEEPVDSLLGSSELIFGDSSDTIDEPIFLEQDTDIADAEEPALIGFDDINISSIHRPSDDDSTELISFDDIDVSINEDIEKYRADESSQSDAVAFDVLEPLSLDVDEPVDEIEEGTFIAPLSPEIETLSLDAITPEIKKDIIDEQITGIGALDHLGIDNLSDVETLSSIEDSPMSIEMLDSSADDLTANIETLSSNDAMDVNLSDSLDLPDNFGSLDNLDSLESLDATDNLDNLEMLDTAVSTITDEQPVTMETPDAFDSMENLEPIGSIEDLSFTSSSVDGFDADNLQTIDESDALTEISDMSDLNPGGSDDIDLGLTPIDNIETLSSNSSDDLVEIGDNFDNFESIDNMSMEIPDTAVEKPLETFADSIEKGPLDMQSIDDSSMSFDNISFDTASEPARLESLNEPEHLDLNEDSNMSFDDISTDEIETFAPVENLETFDNLSIDNIASKADTSLESVQSLETVEDLSINDNFNMSFDNIETEQKQEDKTLNLMPDNAMDTLYPIDKSLDYDNEDETLPDTDNTAEFNNISLSDSDDLKMENSEELMTFNTQSETDKDDAPFTLIEEEESAIKPVDIMQSNLREEQNNFPKKPTIAENVLDEELGSSEEINSEALLAEIDNILGPEAENETDTQQTDEAAVPENDIENHELSPEETIYLQTMAKEKGKKGMTLLLVLVAAFLGVFTITTFIKSSKEDKMAASGIPSDVEVLDSIGNGPVEENKPEPVKVNKNDIQKDISTNAPKLEEIKPEDIKASKSSNDEMYNTNTKGSIYPEVKKITFEVPDYLSYSDGIKKYLQTVGRSVKLSATSDLLLTSDYSVSDRVKVDLKLSPAGDIKTADIDISSGSKQIDKIVLQSVKNTLNVVKPPAGEVKGDDFNLAVIINF